MSAAPFFLVTCEHGGNQVPDPYRTYFAEAQAQLDSHRGFDRGAFTVARELSESLAAPLMVAAVSRLLVDLNRSPHHPKLHASCLPRGVRSEVVQRYYRPYRSQAEGLIAAAVGEGRRVIHLSSHSFTPELDGVVRNADIGLLYDPGRPGEVALCEAWHLALKALAPELRVRRNYPYAGKSDGFCAYLRRRYSAEEYVGVELEVNQRFVLAGGAGWAWVRRVLVDSFGTVFRA